jgi:hypothetical protein
VTKKLAIIVHGFNVSKPERTVGKLAPYFEASGFQVSMLRYGHLGLWRVRKRNIALAKKLAQEVFAARRQGYQVYVVSHSNGGTITRIASEKYRAPIHLAVCINPALKKDLHPCPTAKTVHVYHNADDLPVRLGKWLRRIMPWDFDARPWGEMGCEGYQGDSMRVYNFDTKNDFRVKALGHSGVFKAEQIEFYGPLIAGAASNEEGYATRF